VEGASARQRHALARLRRHPDENRCAEFCTDLCAEARKRGIPVIVDVDRAMSMREGLLTASSHLIFSSEALQATAGVADDAMALRKIAKLTPSFLAGTRDRAHRLARRAPGAKGNAGFSGAHGRHAWRRRYFSRRIYAGDH